GPPYRQPTAGATVHGGRETKSLPFFPPNGLLVLLIAPALVKQVRMMGHKRRKWGESVVVVAATISEGPRCGVPREDQHIIVVVTYVTELFRSWGFVMVTSTVIALYLLVHHIVLVLCIHDASVE
ncbi:hypothetical protein Gohar_014992, partial [Gossypium harknessii]|nr:hypothetical protein [Gossypium harknessii]